MRDGHEVGRGICGRHVTMMYVLCNYVTHYNTGDSCRQLLYWQTKECGALVSDNNAQFGSIYG